MKFNYELVYNESMERIDEGSMNFKFPYKEKGYINCESFEDVFHTMQDNWNYLSNGEWNWSSNEEGTKSEVSFHNCEDGMIIRFEVKC